MLSCRDKDRVIAVSGSIYPTMNWIPAAIRMPAARWARFPMPDDNISYFQQLFNKPKSLTQLISIYLLPLTYNLTLFAVWLCSGAFAFLIFKFHSFMPYIRVL